MHQAKFGAAGGMKSYDSLGTIGEDDEATTSITTAPAPEPEPPTPPLRDRLDAWFRSDTSARNLLLQYPQKNAQHAYYHYQQRSSQIFGCPTDRSLERRLSDDSRAGLQYRSADRGLADTTAWHKRKVALLKSRRRRDEKMSNNNGNNKHDRDNDDDDDDADATNRAATYKKVLPRAASMEEDQNGEAPGYYKFDAKAVSRLERERWLFDKVIIGGIGVVMALTGIVVSKTADTILDKKIEMALSHLETHGFNQAMTLHVGISALLAFLAFLPVAFQPVSAGSGIAEAKAILNGVIIPNCTSLQTAFCKGLSVVMAVSASLPAGLEGPMIHLGLCIGENANRVVPPRHRGLDPLRSERSRIDYAAVGTAAGVAAAFRAPIGGILFAMEEGASYWSTNLCYRCFLSACICVIAMYGIISWTNASPTDTFHITSMDLFNGIGVGMDDTAIIPAGFVPTFDLWEYWVFALAGALGGLVGAMFCIINRNIALVRRKMAMTIAQKGMEVVAVATFYAALIWVLPSLFSKCGNLNERRMSEAYFRQYDCPEGQYNELATLLLNIGGKGITLLFQEDDLNAFSITSCLIAGLVQLVTLCVAFGMSISAGIFIPLLFIGACFGRAFALMVELDPRTYAIVGAAACLGGVVRVMISLTAIVTSTTSLSFFITPIMVATLSAVTVGNFVTGRPGIYDVILQLRDVPFLEEQCPEQARSANIRARNIMKTGLIKLPTLVKISHLIDTLSKRTFDEFPVVDGDSGILFGSISRYDLLALLSRPDIFFTDEEERCGKGSTVVGKILSFAELEQARSALPLPERNDDIIGQHLSSADQHKFLHLSPYIQIAPHTFGGHGSAERAYEMFRGLGLRSLYVVDKHFCPIGVITRHELILLEEIGHDQHEVEKKIETASTYTTPRGNSLRYQFE